MVCPLNGKVCKGGKREDFPKDEVGAPLQCRMWTHVLGMDPQTGQNIDLWDCSVAWMPVLMVENSNQVRQATASIDKTANIVYSALPGPVQEKVGRMLPTLNVTEIPLSEAPKQLPNGDGQAQ
jgi:hypothetical protein